MEHSTDDELMCMHGDIQSRIDRETKEHHLEGKSLEPVEEVDIGVEMSCAEDLHQFFQTKSKIIQLPIKFHIRAAEINKKSDHELSLLINLSNGMYTKRKYDVKCQLLCNGSIIKCDVDFAVSISIIPMV